MDCYKCRKCWSCVNTFAYDLSAYLANILSPLTGKSEYTVTNSVHFVSTVSNETILDNEIMVSFDVESLFTNVPIDDAVQAVLQKLENDPGLADRTTLTPAQIADLLTFVSRPTYFQSQFYLMLRAYPNSFAAAYNNKAYALFSSRRLR